MDHIRALVVTVSDRCSRGEAEDKSGPLAVQLLRSFFAAHNCNHAEVRHVLVPDDVMKIQTVVADAADIVTKVHALIVTTGGTGFGVRDVTPEAVRPLLDKEAPGMIHFMMSESLKKTQFAWLSRAVAGVRKKSMIVTLPGSPKAVEECLSPLMGAGLMHALRLCSGIHLDAHPTSPPQPKDAAAAAAAAQEESIAQAVVIGDGQPSPQHGDQPTTQVPSLRASSASPPQGVSPTEEPQQQQQQQQSLVPAADAADAADSSAITALNFEPSPAGKQQAAASPSAEQQQQAQQKEQADRDAADEAATRAKSASQPKPTQSAEDSPYLRISTLVAGATASRQQAASPKSASPPAAASVPRALLSPPKAASASPPGSATSSAFAASRSLASPAAQQQQQQQQEPLQRAPAASRPRESQYPMMPMNEAFRTILAECPAPVTVARPTMKALRHVVAADVRSGFAHPPFRASIKDGYAVVAADGPGVYPLVGALVAGSHPATFVLTMGAICRVNTGGPVPAGADAVVQVEDTACMSANAQGEELTVRIDKAVKVGHDIRPIGCDLGVGGTAVAKGTVLHAPEIGLALSVGAASILVHKRPVVAVLSTGDELEGVKESVSPAKLAPGSGSAPVDASGRTVTPSAGKIYDSNRGMLLAALMELGYDCVDCGIARDNLPDTRQKVAEALAAADLVITSGGVSMGEADCLKTVLLDLGATIHFGRVNMKPGKPTTFATVPRRLSSGKADIGGGEFAKKVVFALPGNPVSAMVCFHLFVGTALRFMAGCAVPVPQTVQARLKHAVKMDPERPEYHRCHVERDPVVDAAAAVGMGKFTSRDGYAVSSTGIQASHRLLSMSGANGMMIIPAGAGQIAADSIVETVLI